MVIAPLRQDRSTPPSPNDVEAQCIHANGLDFEVLTCGTGDTLALCLHGFPEVALSWADQMRLLAGMGYRVWAPNQRGYGCSTRPPRMEDYALEHLMADVAGLIDASGAKRVVLLGHDWGGIVAWCFCMRQVRPIEQLVIINVPHPACFARSLLWNPAQAIRSWYVGAFQLPWLPERLLARNGAAAIGRSMLRTSSQPDLFPRDLLAATCANAARPGALKAMIDWYRAFVGGGGLKRQRQQGFAIIETPTLLLWGEEDAFLSKHTTDGTDRYVRDLTLRFLPGVSHWVQQDAPELCNAALQAFLASKALT